MEAAYPIVWAGLPQEQAHLCPRDTTTTTTVAVRPISTGAGSPGTICNIRVTFMAKK